MKQIKPIIAICALSAFFCASLCMAPGITHFMDYYGIPEAAASLMLTVPLLVSIPFTILSGKLVDYISRRVLLLASVVIVTICGLAPFCIDNFTVVIILRGIMGIALGNIFSITPTLAAICYPEGRMRNIAMGLQTACCGAGGVICSIISGHLVGIRTDLIFLTYCIGVVIFIVAALTLPPLRVSESALSAKPMSRTQRTSSFDPRCLPLVIAIFVFILCNFSISLNISLFIEGTGMGTSVDAGYVSSAFSVASFVSGCFYNQIVRLCKSRIRSVGCLIGAVGLVLCAVTNTLPLAFAGSALAGLAMTMLMTATTAELTTTVRPAAYSMSVSLMFSLNFLAQSVSVYVITPIANLFGNAVQFRFAVTAAITILLGVFIFWDETRRRRANIDICA